MKRAGSFILCGVFGFLAELAGLAGWLILRAGWALMWVLRGAHRPLVWMRRQLLKLEDDWLWRWV